MGKGRPEALSVWTQLCAVADAGRVRLNRVLQQQAGLTLAENLVLCQVAMAPDRALQMAAISDSLNIGKSAITKTVDRLEERGLLARQRDRSDRRAVYAVVTPAGERLFRKAQPVFVDAVGRLVESLNATELRRLAASLEKLAFVESGPATTPSHPPRGSSGDLR